MIGSLAPGLLLDLLHDIQAQRRSGLLHLIQSGQFRSLRFRAGQIVHGISSVPSEHMGEVLVRDGLLTEEQLARGTEAVLAERKRLGQVLLEQGVLDRVQLEDALARHGREVLLRAFEACGGSFTFENAESERVAPDEVTLRLPTGLMVLEVGRLLFDPDALAYALGDLDRVLAVSEDPLLNVERAPLEAIDAYVLSRVDGTLTAADVVKVMVVPAERTRRSIFALLCAGIIYRRPPGWRRGEPARAPAVPASPPAPPAETIEAPIEPPAAPAEAPAPQDPEEAAARVAEAIRAAEALVAEERHFDAIQALEAALPQASGRQARRIQLLLARVFVLNPKWLRRAEDLLADLTQSDPRDAEATLALATLYADTGRRTRAVALYKKLLELDPENTRAREALRSLEPGPTGLTGTFRRLIKKP